MLSRLTLAAVALVLVATSGAGDVEAASEAQCQALQSQDFSNVIDASTHIMATHTIAAADDVPAYCQVKGYVSSSVEFELRLPLENWNGKFLKRGCGGFCGAVFIAACNNHVKDGYACIASDMGHTSTALDAKWAYNDLQAEIDFGYRATHVVTVAGKAITEAFYSNAPQRSYYMGCSTGGRQGLVEAQRFPYDFDGIVAGAPVIDETGAGMELLWTLVANRDEDGKQILPSSKVPMIHQAVIAKCDMNDGLEDGLIGDARDCDFEPAELQCLGRDRDNCLTTAQVETVNKMYDGPVNSDGMALYTGGVQRGSELNWIGNYISEDGGLSVYEKFMGDMFRYLNFMPDPGPSWQQTDFDFDEDYKRLGLMEHIYTGSNPDLRKYKARGGKILTYQGWRDQSVVPLNIIDYYETVTKTMGGQDATQDFYRLFMIPGMNHCSGGAGAYAIDYLAHMEDWVENGNAPDVLIGVHPNVRVDSAGTDLPLGADKVDFSRPAFPYPAKAQYDGSGDPSLASSFVRVDP
ncbi:MAG: tannase/feruloyl esterase family alpha/beta hydrolase [Alphaproteobacteria bacterium]|nr:tannase/feruloyl esterase family alpha/beta hydrolase [Alphaproteobacteria bacterium]